MEESENVKVLEGTFNTPEPHLPYRVYLEARTYNMRYRKRFTSSPKYITPLTSNLKKKYDIMYHLR